MFFNSAQTHSGSPDEDFDRILLAYADDNEAGGDGGGTGKGEEDDEPEPGGGGHHLSGRV